MLVLKAYTEEILLIERDLGDKATQINYNKQCYQQERAIAVGKIFLRLFL